MIFLIVGNKGPGKTKRLIDMVNTASEQSKGNVICVEKGQMLTFNVTHRVRLAHAEVYGINGYNDLYGFLCGFCAADYDITDIFVDATLRIGGRDFEELAHFLGRVSVLAEETNTKFTFTVSCDPSQLPESILTHAQLI